MLALGQIGLLVIVLALVQWPLGNALAAAATGTRHTRVERAVYRVVGVNPESRQSWKSYAIALMAFSVAGVAVLMSLLMLNRHLPLSQGTPGMAWAGALNTAVSFVTNTNWQWYSGETTLGYAVQAGGLTVQNFLSAAVGIAVAFALARAFAAHRADGVGNFWVDITRVTTRILVPLSVGATLLFLGGGVIDNLNGPRVVTTLAGASQTIPGGPVATQEAIKQIGTNGGGFFNANASHPFENPTAWTNLLSIALLLAIPFALPRALGIILGSKRQGHAILAAMASLWVATVGLLTWAEFAGKGAAPALAGAAMEGKETRFGLAASALYAASTTATSTGSVNASHDSLTAPGSLTAIGSMLLGEIAPGGVGSGLYGMLVIAVLAVFLAGLMVGRTPELYGKKIGSREMSLVAVYTVVTPALVLGGTALTLGVKSLKDAAVTQPGLHGVTSVLYAYASAANNNGSAFGSFAAGGTWQDLLLAVAMFAGRFVPILLVLALAGALAAAPRIPVGAGTLRSDTPLFTTLLVGVAPIIALVAYAPVLALGPLGEALQ
ncbi:potassium-transporting ATPase subunit KdpA [Demequina lutea]|uniref:Potassium-transporting ATPase potassium-binding subunit n=1 Tax=Demequina lutea TaxID=431489 RepID=A0A7Y9ZEE6_9MICO|nr:potassium-transporting ATPase subunit KdpA [Demequina lutea]NYI42713.1 K+-transporting ATPase ATPase A chain [Demequina lutea]